MANPFDNPSQNPFENDGDGNPFDDSNHSIDDIEIPGLDDELDVIVENPFRFILTMTLPTLTMTHYNDSS